MEPKDFIINWINMIFHKFKDVHFKYAYDEMSNYHIIEVSPETFEQSKKFAELYLDFNDTFFKNFPEEDILISAPSEDNDMTNLIYERCGFAPFDNYEFQKDIEEYEYNFYNYSSEMKDSSYSQINAA